jgi:hypothetical protein
MGWSSGYIKVLVVVVVNTGSQDEKGSKLG